MSRFYPVLCCFLVIALGKKSTDLDTLALPSTNAVAHLPCQAGLVHNLMWSYIHLNRLCGNFSRICGIHGVRVQSYVQFRCCQLFSSATSSLRGYSPEPVAVSTITLEYFAIPLAKRHKPNARCVQSFWGYFALFGLTGPTWKRKLRTRLFTYQITPLFVHSLSNGLASPETYEGVKVW